MAVSRMALSEDLGIQNFFKTLKYNHDFYKKNPTYFKPDGLVIFVGPQGSGKSLSAVNYVYKLFEIYPNAKLVTNLELENFPIVTFEDFLKETISFNELNDALSEEEKEEFMKKLEERYLKENKVFFFENADSLQKFSNGKEGVIFLIDEIQLYFNSLASKNINPEVMVQISQQRKQRKHIVATSQVFGRMAKPLREQFDTVIYCNKKLFGYLQKNQLIDRNSIEGESSTDTNLTGKVIKNYWYFRSPDMFKRYDTFKVIDSTKFNYGEERLVDIYDRLSNNIELAS